MGLFGKKDETPAVPEPVVQPPRSAMAQPSRAPVAPQPAPQAAPPAAREPAPPPRAGYGIEQAMRLMRSLPVDKNVDLVVHVIKNTLESLNVRLSDILNDASQRQQALDARIKGLRAEILGLEKEVETRQNEISRLEADLSETTSVKEQLALADASRGAAALGSVRPLAATSPEAANKTV
jgi:hypothetical protein